MTGSEGIYDLLEAIWGSDYPSKVLEVIDSLSFENLAQLSKEVGDFHKQNIQSVFNDLKNNLKEFNSYPLSYHSHGVLDLVRQLSLYSNKIVMRDLIYEALFNPAYTQPNIRAAKESLKFAVPVILELEPLVRNGIIQFVPYPALEKSVLGFAENQIEEDLKNEDWKKEILRGISYKLYPDKNALLMSLGNPSYGNFRFFRYGKIVETKKETGDRLLVKMISPDSLLDEKLGITSEEVNGWVLSEINNEVCRTTKIIDENVVLADTLNTSIVTDNEVYEKLLGIKQGTFAGNSLSNLFPSILQISVPFIENLSFEKLAELREKEANTFLDFQLFLKNLASRIDTSKPSEIQKQIRQISKEELEPILAKLTREYQRIRNSTLMRGFPRAAIAVGTVVTSLVIGEPLIAALGAIASWKLFKDVSDEYATFLEKEAKLKDNSLYFLWKVNKITPAGEKSSSTSSGGFPEKIEINGKELAEKMSGLGIKTYPRVLGDHTQNKKNSK